MGCAFSHNGNCVTFFVALSLLLLAKAECLKETFAELDLTSDVLKVLMSPLHPHFRLKTYGYAGNTQVR